MSAGLSCCACLRQAAKSEYSFNLPLPAAAPAAGFGGSSLVTDLARYHELLGLPPPPAAPAPADIGHPQPSHIQGTYSLFPAGAAAAPAVGVAQGWDSYGGFAGLGTGDAPEAALLAAASVATDGGGEVFASARTANEQDLELNELMAALMCR